MGDLNPSDEIFLEIEGKTLRCNRKVLMEESDYFKAMFEGGFVESNKRTIKLEVLVFFYGQKQLFLLTKKYFRTFLLKRFTSF